MSTTNHAVSELVMMAERARNDFEFDTEDDDD